MAKLLLVEDNDVNRDMLSRRLMRKGYEVAIAIDGAEGVAKALSERPDLVIMDIDLPVIDGYEATRQIKANPQIQNIPIIALTAHAMAGDREQALAAGCDEYETKPVNLPQLLDKVEQLLAAAQPSAPPEDTLPFRDKRVQRALLSHLRHELCTPMNAIIGYSEMLLEELKGQPHSALATDLKNIYTCGTQLLSLANVILDPTQLDVGQFRSDINSFGATIRLEMLTPLSTIIGYCELLLEEADPNIQADLQRIHRAAQQLLSMVNDIVNLSRQQLQLINPNQLDANELTLESGAESAWFKQAETTLQVLRYDPIEDQNSQGGHILIVDDNETNRDLLSRQLEYQGFTVTIAAHGQAALELLHNASYDLILLDLIMPEMNGFEVLIHLKQSPTWQSIPVIMISSLDEIDNVVRCIEMGAEDFLSKPFKPVLLRAKIMASLEKKRLRDQRVMYLARQLIAEATPVPVLTWRWDDGVVLYSNAAARATFGCDDQPLVNCTIQDFFLNQEDYQRLRATLEQGQSIQHYELQCKRADGSPLWTTTSFQPLTYNGEATVLSAMVDITLRKQAEDALRLAEEKYRSIFENALEGIFQSTPDGHFLSVNPAMARIHGYDSAAEMMAVVTEIGNQIYVDPEGRQEFIRQVESSGQMTGYEYQAYRKDGDMMWLSESVRAVRGGNGELLYFEGIVEDVTQRKLKELALKRQVNELKVEIDQAKRVQEVAAITQSAYFQEIQAEAARLRQEQGEGDDWQHSVSAPPGRIKVLLIEDNEMNRDMLSRRLRRMDYEVLTAADGLEGVSMAATHRPDIVLMDMSLPVMDGWEATQKLKANAETASIPVIALTAHAMQGDREKALAIGCDEYDTKPIELPRLLNKISLLLDAKSSG
ncbi:response regulator [Leptolyngbya sp. KIOST-1]|uniref:response regulator n=1 Tax=Leptolyngbya sp. KIOST-1 TaxID=1229172 RepID=UPI000691D98D|nr:response regulator [Leptolyngbya sp. KIOST-1]